MAREPIATRDAVFEAASKLERAGRRTSVAAIRDEIGGGSNTSIQRLLGDWRRTNRNGSGKSLNPKNGISCVTHSVNNAKNPSQSLAILPDTVEDLIYRFTYHLSLAWSESLTEVTPDDTLAVIRAAAEARVREAEHVTRMLEDEQTILRGDLSILRAERDGLASAMEVVTAQLEEMQKHNDSAYRIAGTRRNSRAIWESTGLVHEEQHLEQVALQTEKERLEEITRVQEVELKKFQTIINKARAEFARLTGERDRLKQEIDTERREIIATLTRERQKHSIETQNLRTELEDMTNRAAKQAAWIRTARGRLTKYGLLKPRTKVG